MDARKLNLLRHALGMEGLTPGYRNHFAAEPGSEDDVVWAAMVTDGLAVKTREPSAFLPYRYYAASKAGKEAVGCPPPFLSTRVR